MRMAKGKMCLVAGGAGFIGSHLCNSLLGAGYRVMCMDNLITGQRENADVLKHKPGFTFILHDITKPVPAIPKVDYIFHLASPASVIDYQKYPLETALANSFGTMMLLDLAGKYNSKFLFASTSEIYGDPKVNPQKESYWGNVNPVGVRACYDESKRYGEMMTMLY